MSVEQKVGRFGTDVFRTSRVQNTDLCRVDATLLRKFDGKNNHRLKQERGL